ncbi:MAG: hydrogenase maturation nickel metallochaperone HypA [Thermotogae bacterium]|nr:hydrogenase maturation nickel metallochaperone HypA [Thermotogota bacterium]
MHELSILQAIYLSLREIARRYGARRVLRFRLEVGELANVVPELLEEAFAVLKAAEPLIADAVMEYSIVPLTLRCPECGYYGPWRERTVRCPECGSATVDVVDGEDLYLRDVELDIPEENYGQDNG